MFNPSGFDYDLLISRLHGGVLAFQSLRAHRRQRCEAPAPTTQERPTAPPTPPAPQPAPQADPRPIAVEPQAFISVGGRMVPIFGELGGDLFPAPPGPATASPASDPSAPAPPRAAPEQPTPPPPTPPPAPAPSPLKLPPPTPPPHLAQVYGQRRSAANEPSSSTSSDDPTRTPQAATSPAPAQEAASIATLTAILAARADEEAHRLEKLHAEHRACVAQLLQQHRDELQARVEAESARTAQLLRDVLAEHRAELASAAQAHADQLAQILSVQQQAAEPRHDLELRSALLEQARQQRDTTDELAEHITSVTTLVADLGQTISMLAVAAAREGRASTALPVAPRPTFAPPPRSAPPANPQTPPLPTRSPEAPTNITFLNSSVTPPTATAIVHNPDAFTDDTGITTEQRWSG